MSNSVPVIKSDLKKCVPYGFPTLHKPADQVPDEVFKNGTMMERIGAVMCAVAVNPSEPAIGISAPQLGLPYAIMILMPGIDGDPYGCFIANPSWKPAIPSDITKAAVQTDTEGCRSIPGLRFDIPRHYAILASYQTADGSKVVDQRFEGLAARVFQHEYDHMVGKTLIDYLPEERQKSIQPVLKRLTKIAKQLEEKYGSVLAPSHWEHLVIKHDRGIQLQAPPQHA